MAQKDDEIRDLDNLEKIKSERKDFSLHNYKEIHTLEDF